MITYAFFLSYCITVISCIVAASDEANERFNSRLEVLDRVHNQCSLPIELYTKLKQSLRYRYDMDTENLNHFLDELPTNLRVQVAMYIHEQTWVKIAFFNDASDNFITWMCTLLKPAMFPAETVIYDEDEKIQNMYFLTSG